MVQLLTAMNKRCLNRTPVKVKRIHQQSCILRVDLRHRNNQRLVLCTTLLCVIFLRSKLTNDSPTIIGIGIKLSINYGETQQKCSEDKCPKSPWKCRNQHSSSKTIQSQLSGADSGNTKNKEQMSRCSAVAERRLAPLSK
jgi:hypothetical protein